MVWMIWTRTQGYESLIVAGQPEFFGIDPWYQFRTTMYTVRNWPATPPYEVWSGYPTGALKGQFGTLFDQLVAAIAIIISGGNPTPTDVKFVLFFIPPVLGALTALPVYYIARIVTENRKTAVLAVGFLALFAGPFYTRTLVGFGEHNAVEPLAMGVAVAAMLWMLRKEQSDKPLDNLLSNDARYRRLYRRALVAGIALAFYLSMWPPGIVLVAIIGLLTVFYSLGFAAYIDRDTTGLLTPIGMALLVASLLMVLRFETTRVTVVAYGPLQVLFPFAAGVLAVALPRLEKYRQNQGKPWYTLLSVATAMTVGVLTVGLLVVPEAVNEVLSNAGEVFGLGLFAGERITIAEAQPLWSFRLAYDFFGLVMFIAVLVLPETLARAIVNREWVRLFASFWAVMLFIMGLSQIRFGYYFALPAAVFGAYMIQRTFELFELAETPIRELDRQQVFVTVSMLAVVVSLVGPAAVNPVYKTGQLGDTAADDWRGVTTWMNDNTPPEGQLQHPENQPLDYNKTYSQTDDFEYPEGSYGVIAPWEAGHFITVFGNRIPIANPFQQHVSETSQFVYATDEEEARNTVTQELDAEHPERYVLMTWDFATLRSPVSSSHLAYHPTLEEDAFSQEIVPNQSGFSFDIGVNKVAIIKNESYYETMAFRMYQHHGSRVPESSHVVRWDEKEDELVPPQNQPVAEDVDSPEAADRIAANDSEARDGGVGLHAPEPVPALKHYRMVRASERNASTDRYYTGLLDAQRNMTGLETDDFYNDPQYVKMFERVPGATVTGTAPPNTTVNATVTMRTHRSTTFQYTQHAQSGSDGSFNMSLPYSTTGYDNWGPEKGYTNVSTRATAPYQVTAGDCSTTIDVTEAEVIGESNRTANVEVCEG